MDDGQIRAAPHPGNAHILVVTIDHPPVNAMTPGQYRRLAEIFDAVSTQQDIRCAILTGAGERVFVGGADVKQLSARTTADTLQRSALARRAFDAVRRCAVPVVAAVNGAAIGAGLVIASCCDIMVSATNAKFSLPEIDVGVLGGTRHLARIVPDKVVRLMALTGRRVGPEFLAQFGAVHEIVDPAELMAAALRIAGEIAGKSPAIARLMKEAINLTEAMPLNEGYRVEQLFTTLATELPDSKEAARAFVEKRPPRFG